MNPGVYRFHAMNTVVALLGSVPGPRFERASTIVQQTFARIERCLSRFQPESELSVLNRSEGRPFHASPLLLEAVALAIGAAQETDGIFDPTILNALEHAGYDRSFERIGARTSTRPQSETGCQPNYEAVCCDMNTGTIRLAAGQRIDLGGIGKGLAVDHALAATGFLRDRCIAAGGDVAARGTDAFGTAWSLQIEDTGESALPPIAVRDAAVATSTISKRRWSVSGEEQHHLIDPRTGRPSSSPLRSVTVVAPSCVQADVAAKTALLLGEDGMVFLEDRGLHGLAVRRNGSTIHTSQWPRVEHSA